jgi:hypothetical protein
VKHIKKAQTLLKHTPLIYESYVKIERWTETVEESDGEFVKHNARRSLIIECFVKQQ